MIGAPPRSPLFPSPPLSRSAAGSRARGADGDEGSRADHPGRRSGPRDVGSALLARAPAAAGALARHAAGADARTGARPNSRVRPGTQVNRRLTRLRADRLAQAPATV